MWHQVLLSLGGLVGPLVLVTAVLAVVFWLETRQKGT